MCDSDDDKLRRYILSSSSLSEAVKKMTPLSNTGHPKSKFLLGCITIMLSTNDEEWVKGYDLILTSGDPRVENFTWILPYAQSSNSAYSRAFRVMCHMAVFYDDYFARVRLNADLCKASN